MLQSNKVDMMSEKYVWLEDAQVQQEVAEYLVHLVRLGAKLYFPVRGSMQILEMPTKPPSMSNPLPWRDIADATQYYRLTIEKMMPYLSPTRYHGLVIEGVGQFEISYLIDQGVLGGVMFMGDWYVLRDYEELALTELGERGWLYE